MIKNKNGWTLFHKSWEYDSDTFDGCIAIDSDTIGLGFKMHRGDFTFNVDIYLPFIYIFMTWYFFDIERWN